MREEKVLVNTVISDGNRTVNWDIDPSETVRAVLTRWGFEWEPYSVIVCGFLLSEKMLDYPIAEYRYTPSIVYDYANRVFIRMKQPQKKKEERKEEQKDAC